MRKKTITADVGVSMAISKEGTLWAWGWNEFGNLGTGTTSDSNAPLRIASNIVFVSAGVVSAAICKDGNLWTWGNNSWGGIGDGTNVNRHEPVYITNNVVRVSTGGSHTMAIKSDNSLWTWGANDTGQFGNGTIDRTLVTVVNDNIVTLYDGDPIERYTPKKVHGNMIDVFSAGTLSMALTADENLVGWGLNNNGQLGKALDSCIIGKQTFDANSIGWSIYGLTHIMSNVLTVSIGSATMAVTTDGGLWSWGCNYFGERGDGNLPCPRTGINEVQYTPKRIMENIVDVSTTHSHVLALDNDGGLWTWGRNTSGELGDGTYANRYTPHQIMENVAMISAGNGHSMAVTKDGSLWMWGCNAYGQLGIGDSSIPNSNRPIKIMDDMMLP